MLTKSYRTEFVVSWDLDSPANRSIARKIPCMILLHWIRSCVFVLKYIVTNCFYFIPLMCLLAFIFQVSSFQDQSSTWNTACSSKWRRQHVWLHTLACLLREMVRIPEALREVQIFSKSQRKTYTFRRRQRAADRQGSALPKHTAAWFAPMRKNNQDWRVSYCFLALLLLFCKGLMDWNWCMPI